MATRTLSFGNITFGGETYRVSVEVTGAGDKCLTQEKASEVTAAVQKQIRTLLGTHARIFGAANPRTGPLPAPNKYVLNETGVEYVGSRSSRTQTHESDTQKKAKAQWEAFQSIFIPQDAPQSAPADANGAVEVPPKRTVTANVARADAVRPRLESKQPLQRSDSERSNSALRLPSELDSDPGTPRERQDSGLLSDLIGQAKAMLPGAHPRGKAGMLLHENDNGVGTVPAEAAEFGPIPGQAEHGNGQPRAALKQAAHPRSSEARSSEGPSSQPPRHLDISPAKKGKQEKVKSTLPPGYEYDQALWTHFRNDYYSKVIDGTITLQGLIGKLGEEHEDVGALKQIQAACKAEHAFRTKQKERANGQAAQTGTPLGVADRVDQGPTLEEVTKRVLRYHVIKRDQEMIAAPPRSYSDLGEL